MFVTLTMLVAALGCLNTCILTIARIYFAQANDGLFFRRFARVHPRFHTPSSSLALQGLMSAVFAASGTYETLFSYSTFGGWIFYVLAVVGLVRLRILHPERPRPFRMPGYPVTPIVFVAVGAAFIISTLVTTPGPSFVGLAISAAGIPLFFYWNRRRTRQ
jgi:APA family basic amino acid/polyamine antiporter